MGEGEEDKIVRETANDMKASLTSTMRCLQTRCQVSDDLSFFSKPTNIASWAASFYSYDSSYTS